MRESIIRTARAADVPAIVAMLADDPLGASREHPGDPAYLAAFAALDGDPRQLLVVADADGEPVGTLQHTPRSQTDDELGPTPVSILVDLGRTSPQL